MFLFQQAFCHFSWLKGGVGENTDGTPFPEKRYTSPLVYRKELTLRQKRRLQSPAG